MELETKHQTFSVLAKKKEGGNPETFTKALKQENKKKERRQLQ